MHFLSWALPAPHSGTAPHRTGVALRRKMWWQHKKMWLIIIIVLLILVLVIFLSVCLGGGANCFKSK